MCLCESFPVVRERSPPVSPSFTGVENPPDAIRVDLLRSISPAAESFNNTKRNVILDRSGKNPKAGGRCSFGFTGKSVHGYEVFEMINPDSDREGSIRASGVSINQNPGKYRARMPECELSGRCIPERILNEPEPSDNTLLL